MKTKTYTFTEIELLALRDSLEEMKYSIKSHKPVSPIIIERNKAVIVLHEQFKNDYRGN